MPIYTTSGHLPIHPGSSYEAKQHIYNIVYNFKHSEKKDFVYRVIASKSSKSVHFLLRTLEPINSFSKIDKLYFSNGAKLTISLPIYVGNTPTKTMRESPQKAKPWLNKGEKLTNQISNKIEKNGMKIIEINNSSPLKKIITKPERQHYVNYCEVRAIIVVTDKELFEKAYVAGIGGKSAWGLGMVIAQSYANECL